MKIFFWWLVDLRDIIRSFFFVFFFFYLDFGDIPFFFSSSLSLCDIFSLRQWPGMSM